MLRRILLSIIFGVLVYEKAASEEADLTYYPVIYSKDRPNEISIDGPIDTQTALNFHNAIKLRNEISTISLNSPGGDVGNALLIAISVHSLNIKSVVKNGSECYSACSLIFFAGKERLAYGKLGVHQIRFQSNRGTVSQSQIVIAEILDSIREFDVPVDAVLRMLRTPPESMYVFTEDEKSELGFLGTSEDHESSRYILSSDIDKYNPCSFTDLNPGEICIPFKDETPERKPGEPIYATSWLPKTIWPPIPKENNPCNFVNLAANDKCYIKDEATVYINKAGGQRLIISLPDRG